MRTDIHRPGAIVPSNYTPAIGYILPGADSTLQDVFNLDEARTLVLTANAPIFGAFGKCGVCGANFRYGMIWRHVNGDLVHMGRDCSDKYELLANWAEFDARREALARAHAARIEAARRTEIRSKILADNPGLDSAFETSHHIIEDIRARFNSRPDWITDRQITLVFKIAKETRERAAKTAEPTVNVHVGTPGKRETFSVTLDFVTGYETPYGYTTVLKFKTPTGATLVWKASNPPVGRKDVGRTFALTGTVKEHGEYKGAKQTIVSRCKVA